MKKFVASMVAVAGLAAAAQAQVGTSHMTIEVSADGVTWGSSADVQPGAVAHVRYRISLDGTQAMGLSGLNMQPTFGGWDNTGAGAFVDALMAFADTGSNSTTPAGGVTDASGDYGRILPFAAPNVTTTNRLRGHLSGSTMRVAQNGTTNNIGVGSASNNVNGSGGVPVSQSGGFFAPPPTFQFGTENVLFLKLGVRVSEDVPATDRLIQCDAPAGGFSLYGPTGSQVRAANWLTGYSGSGSPTTNYAPVVVHGATIRVVPTPASLALLGLGGLVAGRRRR